MREDGKRNSEEDSGVLRRSRRMSSYQESPAASQSLSSILPRLPFQAVQRTVKKKGERKCRKRCSTLVFQKHWERQKSHQMPGTKKGFSCNMYNWAFRKKEKKKTSQCFSLFIGQINLLGHLSYLRAGNCALKILADRLEDGHIHWSKKRKPALSWMLYKRFLLCFLQFQI